MVELVRKLGAFIACGVWCCAVRAHSYEASAMFRTQVDTRERAQGHQKRVHTFTKEADERQKKKNRERMRKLTPLPSMVGTITRVGEGGFQFVEHMGNGGVMQGRTVMCGRYSPQRLKSYQQAKTVVRIFVCKNNNRAPILVSLENLSGVTVENMERNGLL